MSVSAKVICDSISPQGIRLTTMQISLHRYVLAEFNTHRVFSRNFRSSRAVPVHKLLSEALTNPAVPVQWLKNKPGMQATESMSEVEQGVAELEWRSAARSAVEYARSLADTGLHKQWANRVIEPFLYVHGVVTSTKWKNFFSLRHHPDAQPEMFELAKSMLEAFTCSEPKELKVGEWHLPYFEADDDDAIRVYFEKDWSEKTGEIAEAMPLEPQDQEWHELRCKLSAARCARVSYKVFDADRKPTIEEDLALYTRLIGSKPMHMSPTEHQATPDFYTDGPLGAWQGRCFWGNFHGWQQYRKTIPGESGEYKGDLA